MLQEKNNIDIYSHKSVNVIIDLCEGNKIKALSYYSGIEAIASRAKSEAVLAPEKRLFDLLNISRELEKTFSRDSLIEVLYAMHGYLMLELKMADAFVVENLSRVREGSGGELVSEDTLVRTLVVDQKTLFTRVHFVLLILLFSLPLAMAALFFLRGKESGLLEHEKYSIWLSADCADHGISQLFLSSHGVRVSQRVGNLAFPAILKTDKGKIIGSVTFPQGTWENPVLGKVPRGEWFVFESNDGRLTLESETVGQNSYADLKDQGIFAECSNAKFLRKT